MHALCDVNFCSLKAKFDFGMMRVIKLAQKTSSINLVKGYMEDRGILTKALQVWSGVQAVQKLIAMPICLRSLWKDALTISIDLVKTEVYRFVLAKQLPAWKVDLGVVYGSVLPVGFGNYDSSCPSIDRWANINLVICPVLFELAYLARSNALILNKRIKLDV